MFSSAYLVTLAHVAHRPQVVRKKQRRASAAPSGHRPLRTPPRECNKCSAPSRVYPLTEQWFVPPWRGSLSLGRIIPPEDYLLRPSRPEEKAGGPTRVVLRFEKSGGPAADRVALPIPRASVCLSTKSLISSVISTVFATLPRSHRPPSERISHSALLCSARQRKKASFESKGESPFV